MRPSVVRGNEGWFDVTKSLFHHLVDNLDYDEYMDKLFHRFVDMYQKHFWEYWDEHWQQYNVDTGGYEDVGGHGYGDFSWDKAIKAFTELISQRRNGNRRYNYWEFEGDNFSEYTYNNENILSQDFIFDTFGAYAFIRTHNGCDARGGFSYPHLFYQKDEYGLMDYDRYTIGCENGHWWDYEGGYENTECDVELKKCEWVDYDDIEQEDLDRQEEIEEEYRLVLASWEKQIQMEGIDNPRPTPPENCFIGKILVRDGEAFCPVCGSKLGVSSY